MLTTEYKGALELRFEVAEEVKKALCCFGWSYQLSNIYKSGIS